MDLTIPADLAASAHRVVHGSRCGLASVGHVPNRDVPNRDVLADRPLSQPSNDRLALDHPRRADILAAHAKALEADEAGYLDPDTALFVLTARFHAERGHCCLQGCRHCPYVEDLAT
jgi:hypothetical protein